MKLLRTIKDKDISPSLPEYDVSTYEKREAARAVVLNNKEQVHLLYIAKHGYHKLPGGGVDPDETIEQALHRELLEEIGCKTQILKPIGRIIEHREFYKQIQTSFCYLAKQSGELLSPQLEQSEIDEGATQVFVDNIDKAIALLDSDKPDNDEGKMIQMRDLVLLREAKNIMTLQ